MSFAQGFASTFVPLLGQAVSQFQQYEMDQYNNKIAEFKEQRKIYEDGKENSERLKEQAKLLTQSIPGVPPSSWTAVYNELHMGRTLEGVRKDLVEGRITRRSTPSAATGATPSSGGIPSGPSPAGASPAMPMTMGGVDQQMGDSGLAMDGQVGTTDGKLNIERGTEDDSVGFSFSRMIDDRAEERFRTSVGVDEDYLQQVRTGFKPSPMDTEFVINPARTGEKKLTLTPGQVAGQYSALKTAAASGDPTAVQAFDNYVQNELPIQKEALRLTRTEGSPDVDSAMGALIEAENSGDEEKIEEAREALDQQLRKQALVEGAKSSNDIQLLVTVDENGQATTTTGYVRPSAQGTVFTDAQGQPLEGSWRPVNETEEQRRTALTDKISVKERLAYRKELDGLASGLNLVGEINDIVSNEDLVLTSVAGGVSRVAGLFREASAIGEIFSSLADRGGPVTEEEFNNELVRQGVLRSGQSFQNLAAQDILGQRGGDLATLRSVLDSKLILAAYRIAGLEGQQGQGLSDKDVKRMDQLLQPSSNPDVFRESLADYFRDRIQTVESQGESFKDLGTDFERTYGYNPMEQLTPSLQSRIDSREGVRKGYEFVMNTGSTVDRILGQRQQQQQQPAPQAQPQAAQPQRRPHQAVQGYSPAGWTPEGVPVYRDDATGQMVTE